LEKIKCLARPLTDEAILKCIHRRNPSPPIRRRCGSEEQRPHGRANRGFSQEHDLWDLDAQWNYERGRCFAVVAPADVPLRIKGKINPRAVELFERLLPGPAF
jgi:hypothetical protein